MSELTPSPLFQSPLARSVRRDEDFTPPSLPSTPSPSPSTPSAIGIAALNTDEFTPSLDDLSSIEHEKEVTESGSPSCSTTETIARQGEAIIGRSKSKKSKGKSKSKSKRPRGQEKGRMRQRSQRSVLTPLQEFKPKGVFVDACGQYLRSKLLAGEEFKDEEIVSFFKDLLTSGESPDEMAAIGAKHYRIFNSLKRSFPEEEYPARTFMLGVMTALDVDPSDVGAYSREFDTLIGSLNQLLRLDLEGVISPEENPSDIDESSIPASSTPVIAESSTPVILTPKAERLQSLYRMTKPEDFVYSPPVLKAAEFYETVLVNAGREVSAQEREMLRDFVHCMSQEGGAIRAEIISSGNVGLFLALKSQIYPSNANSSKMSEITQLSRAKTEELSNEEEVQRYNKILSNGGKFIQIFNPSSTLESTLDNYCSMFLMINKLFSTIVDENSTPEKVGSAKTSLHLQLEKFFHLNGIKLPIVIDTEDQFKDLVKLLMHALFIPPEHERQFSQLLYHVRKRNIFDATSNTTNTMYSFPYVNFTRWGDKWTRALPPSIKPLPLDPQAVHNPKILAEVMLLCEDLNTLLESAGTGNGHFNPLEGLRILSRLSPVHWSALNENQMQIVQNAFYQCLNPGINHAAYEQGVALLQRTLAETTDMDEILNLSKFIQKVVYDLGMRPELQRMIQERMSSIEESKNANLAADQQLIRDQLIARVSDFQPEGILTSLWFEPAQTLQVVSSSSSSSTSASPALVRTLPTPALRAYKAILEIVKDKSVSEEVKIRLLNNLISWIEYPYYPKLSNQPELIHLAKEITDEIINQYKKQEEEALMNRSSVPDTDRIVTAFEERPKLLETAQRLETCLLEHAASAQDTISPASTSVTASPVSDPGAAIDAAVNSLMASRKGATPAQIASVAQSLKRESLVMFSNLDLSDLCVPPYGATFSNFAQHNSQVSDKVANHLMGLIGTEITKTNKAKVIRMLTFFHALAENSLQNGDVNMYFAIAGGLTRVQAKVESYDRSHRSKSMRQIHQHIKNHAANLTSQGNYSKLRALNATAYDRYRTLRIPPIPTTNYIGQDLTFLRDGNKPIISSDKTVNLTLYNRELETFTFLSNCLSAISGTFSMGDDREHGTPTR